MAFRQAKRGWRCRRRAAWGIGAGQEGQKAGKAAAAQQTTLGDDQGDQRADEPGADLALDLGGDREGANTFTPDPSLAFLTSSGGTAPKLVTDRPAPERGKTPATRKVGEWDNDQVLQLEGALEAARNLFDDAGPAGFNTAQVGWLSRLWGEVVERMERTGMGEA